MVNCGSVQVQPQFDQSAVQLVSCSLQPSSGPVAPSDTVQATAQVQNNNQSGQATVQVAFTAGGTQIGTTDVTVPAGSSRNASVTFTPNSVGVSSGSMQVSSSLASVSQQQLTAAESCGSCGDTSSGVGFSNVW